MKVSVLMTAYNHERFIRQALDGALMQRVGFDYEIVIGEDCSTDGTRAILQEYQERYPERVRLLLREKNLGPGPNWLETFHACRGTYIALLEGDDYWTAPHKLQKQVDFLDAHPGYSFSFHNATVIHENGVQPPSPHCGLEQKETVTVEDLLERNVVPTCSTVFRRGLSGRFPDWYVEMRAGDWALHLLNAAHGPARYLPETMGVYRVHAGGVWASRDRWRQMEAVLPMYDHINRHLKFAHDRLITGITAQWLTALAEKYRSDGEARKARHFAWRALAQWRRSPADLREQIVVTFLRAWFPAAERLYWAASCRLRRRGGGQGVSGASGPA